MITVIYKDVDITNDISINRCYHDMYAEGQSDTLHITLNDAKNYWDTWQPQEGDEIEVVYGSITTGKMFVDSASPENGLYNIVATSVPSTSTSKQGKSWQQVKLTQIGKEISENHGLKFETYGVEDQLYNYILQTNENDFSFLNRLCTLEGCAFLVFNGSLVLYGQSYMEQIEPLSTIKLSNDSDYSYKKNESRKYSSCLLEKGNYKGEFKIESKNINVYVPSVRSTDITISNDAEASRYAKNLLRSKNKDILKGYLYSRIMPELAAASVVSLENQRAPSWDGVIFITHIRNDYANGKAKVFFRKPLQGY